MKLILDTDSLRPPLTGIGRYAAELARGLPRAPEVEEVLYLHRARFIAAAPDGVPSVLPASLQARLLESVIAPVRNRLARYGAMQRFNRRFLEFAQRRFLRRYPDHIFLAPNYFLPPVSGPAVAVFHDLSLIKHPEWHPLARLALGDFMFPRTLERADHIIVDAQAIRRELIDHTGYPPNRITAIPLGVDAVFHPRSPEALRARLHQYDLSPGGYVLTVATIEPRKNLPTLLNAHAQLPPLLRRRYPLILAGSGGWNSAPIHDRILQAERAGHARYLSYVAESDLPLLVAGARLAAQPSLYEGFGLPSLEAMASGVPLVTSTCPTLLELTGGLALAVDALDTGGLTDALRQGLEDDVWRAGIIPRALDRARGFTWEACVERTVQTLAAVRAQ